MATAAIRNKLECNVCLELFKTPKILPCYHTFCQKCLEGLSSNSTTRGSFKCPTCRRDTAVPRGGVSAFQTNFYLTDELDAKRKERDTEHCVLHQDQLVTLVCKTCNIRICPQCKATRHKEHKTLLFNEEIASAREDLKHTAAELGDRANTLEKALRKVPTDEKAAEKKIQEAKKTVMEKTDAWVATVIKSRDKALKSIEEAAAKRQTELDENILSVQRDQQKTKAFLEQAEDAALKDSGTTVLSARDVIKVESSRLKYSSTAALIGDLSKSSEPPSISMNNELLKQLDAAFSSLSTHGLLTTPETSSNNTSRLMFSFLTPPEYKCGSIYYKDTPEVEEAENEETLEERGEDAYDDALEEYLS